jgi:hypothetical protein
MFMAHYNTYIILWHRKQTKVRALFLHTVFNYYYTSINKSTELGIHVTTKFVQAFGLIGTLMVGPIVASTNVNTRNWEGMKESMTSKGTGGHTSINKSTLLYFLLLAEL